MLIYSVVAGLALVQSIFGIGLLLFGTPVLILIGLPFEEALWILLPASITVSGLQLLLDRRLDPSSGKALLVWTVPSVCVGLLLVLSLSIKFKIDIFVIAALVVSAVLRFSDNMKARLASVCEKYRSGMLLTIGFVHGLTNMGGSMLSVYAASQSSDKYVIRQHIALGYLFFAATQLAVLFSTRHGQNYPVPFPFMLIAGLTFLVVGRRTFFQLNHQRYSFLLNVFMLICAALLIAKNFVL